jgi:hypothetical protein
MPNSSHVPTPISVEPDNVHLKKMAPFIAIKASEFGVTFHESNFSIKDTVIVSNPQGYFESNGEPLPKDIKCII